MHLELSLGNEPQVLPGVRIFIRTTLLQLALPTDESEQLSQLVTAAVEDAVANAYPNGEAGLIKLTICEKAGKLEIRIRDFGPPQDVQNRRGLAHFAESSEQNVPVPFSESEQNVPVPFSADGSGIGSKSAVGRLPGSGAADVVDQMHWIAFGPRGKALQLVKWLPASNIADTSSTDVLAHVPPNVPLATEQQYVVRRMLPEEAVQVSQLMYRTYGATYFNKDVYYPDRIANHNLHGDLLSIVAVADDGRVAGHCALERNQEGPVAEIGQAAVDPAHRGRGLLDRMKDALEKEARALGLVGWYADAVAVHTFTQQSDAHHGGHVCGIDLAVSPKTEAFRHIAGGQPQRVSCVLYFHWLGQPLPRTVFVPSRHREVAAAIYDNLQCPFEFGSPASPTQEHGTLTVKVDSRARLATIRAGRLGTDSLHAIRHASREVVERSQAKVVIVELPLGEPATVEVCEALEADGLAFTGIGPHFSSQGDVLKLAYLVEPLTREPIKIFEPIADRLVEYALAEQERVRANL